jgi:hypothetical protein
MRTDVDESSRLYLNSIEERLDRQQGILTSIHHLLGGRLGFHDDDGLSMRVLWLYQRMQKTQDTLLRIELLLTGMMGVLIVYAWRHW